LVATTFTIANITADVAALSNSPTFTSSTRVTSSQVTYWITQSARALSALLRQKLGEDLDLIQTATLTTTPSFNLVSLPSNCGEVHSVVWVKAAEDYQLLATAAQEDLELAFTPAGAWECGPRYRLEGNTIALYPASTSAESLLVYYTTHLDGSGTDFQGRLDFDRWVTLDVVCRVLEAKNKDATRFLQQKMLLEKDLFAPSRKREPLASNTIRDVRASGLRHYIRNRWGS
jgi:hypothetical protein